MTTITVVPPGAAAGVIVTPPGDAPGVTTDGFARSSLVNVTDAVLLARILGLNLPFGDGAVPSLYDYTGSTYQGDPTGQHSSDSALRQLAADCSAISATMAAKFVAGGVDPALVASLPGVVGFAAPGNWVHDGLPLDFWYGSGLAQPALALEGATPGTFGCTILRPHRTGYDMEVPFPLHPGNHFRFAVHYPDRLAEAGNINSSGVGSLVQYAPTFATDHLTDRTGAATTTGNTGFFHVDAFITGANTGVFCGEATLSEEAWAVSPSGRVYSLQNGRQCGGYYVDIRGMCMDRGVVRNRIGVTSTVESTRNGFGPQCWTAASSTNLHQYLQKNCSFHTMGHRATGFRLNAKVRHCKQALRFLGGVPPAAWTGSLSGRDNGRYAAGEIIIHTEQVPNLVTWESDAWPTGVSIDYNGLGKDFFDNTNTSTLIQHLTDKDIAGELRVRDGYPAGQWKPCTNFGVMIDYKTVSRNSCGPVIVIPAVSPQGLISFLPGSRFSSWNVNNQSGSSQSVYGFQHLAAENNMVLSFLGGRMNAHFGSDYIFWGTQDLDGQNTDPTNEATFNPNYGMVKGIEREAMQYFGYGPSNLSHACNIQPFDGHGGYFAVGFPDGDDGDGGDS